jgi:hypothetical protein
MDDKATPQVMNLFLLTSALTGAFVLAYQQQQIDTLGRQVEVLERNSVNHGARLDAQTMAEAQAFRGVEKAGGLPGWVDAMPVDAGGKHAGSASVCPECGLKQYPPPDKEHLRKP